MADLVFLAIVVVFFGAMVLLVHACDRIVGPDPSPVDARVPAVPTHASTEREPVAR